MNMNRTVKLASILLVGVMIASACTQTYSQAPLGTPTLIPTGLFVSPFPSGQDPLQIIADLGTQTAQAQTAEAGGGTVVATNTSGTTVAGTPVTQPAVTVVIGTPATANIETQVNATLLPVTVIPGGSTFTPTTQAGSNTIVAPTVAVGTPLPAGSVPATYTLQKGEWPYCIARRYNVDPNALMQLSGLTAAESYSLTPGQLLKLPQNGVPFPSTRVLHAHPSTWTVDPGDTLGSIACWYGDLTPEQVAAANNLSTSSTLTTGATLTIP